MASTKTSDFYDTYSLTIENELDSIFKKDQLGTFNLKSGFNLPIIYPEGKPFDGPLNPVYYKNLFSLFNKSVSIDSDGSYSIRDVNLTSMLSNMYSTMVYELSTKDRQEYSSSVQANQEKIGEFYNGDWSDVMGVGSIFYKSASDSSDATTWYWIKEQNNNDDSNSSQAGLSPTTQWKIIRDSLAYICRNALFNPQISLLSSYWDYSFKDLYNLVVNNIDQASSSTSTSLDVDWTSIFTGNLPKGLLNPWNKDLYSKYIQLDMSMDLSESVIIDALVANTAISSANSYLRAYEDNTKSDFTTIPRENYSTLFGSSASQSFSDAYIPKITYELEPSDIGQILSASNQEASSVSINLMLDDNNEVWSIGASPDSPNKEILPAISNKWIFLADDGSYDIQQYDNQAAVISGQIDFKNVGYQAWTPSSSGESAWLLLDAIEAAISNGSTPNSNSPNFKGGYGWNNAADAQKYTDSGFAYIKSFVFTKGYMTSLVGSTSKGNGNLWGPAEFTSSQFGNENSKLAFGSYQSFSSLLESDFNANNLRWSVTNYPQSLDKSSVKILDNGLQAYSLGTSFIGLCSQNKNYQEPAQASSRSLKKSNSNGNYITSKWSSIPNKNGSNDIPFDQNSSSTASSSVGTAEESLTDKAEKWYLDSRSNICFGSKNDDHVFGRKGKDEIYGKSGDDILLGGRGRDYLSGGQGKNTLRGGKGADYFELNLHEFKRSNMQIIADFKCDQDVLWFVGGVHSDLISFQGKMIYYGDDEIPIAKIKGLSTPEILNAIDTAIFL